MRPAASRPVDGADFLGVLAEIALTGAVPPYNPTMDYSAIINALRAQADQIDHAIAQLETLNSPDGSNGSCAGVEPANRRRGRQSMGPEERKVVAERMKRYWASRKRKQM